MKKILLAAAIFVLLTSTLPARQWTSRNGGFSVEAELVDVKNGDVILKKDNGDLVTVPLNKLSLGDIRYINEAFKAAEAGVTGGKPTPAADEKPGTPTSKKTVTADVGKLRYHWRKGQKYVYQLRISADRGNCNEYIMGQVTYKVNSVTDDEIELVVTKQLTRGQTLDASQRRVGLDDNARFLSNYDSSREVTITIDPSGQVLHVEGSSQLPYLLGDLSQLVIERLGTPTGGTWTVTNDTGVVVVPSIYPSVEYSRAHGREGVPATEKIVYTIEGQKDHRIAVKKHYRLETASTVDGKPRFEAAGDGRLAFDMERGITASLRFDARVTIRETNKTEEIPFHVSYRLLSEDDLVEAAKAAEEKKREALRIQKEKERPLSVAEMESALAELTSGDSKQIDECLKRLAEKKPRRPDRKIAQAIESILSTSEQDILRAEAARALIQWSTPESVPALIKALKDERPMVVSCSMNALCKYKPKEAIKPVTQLLSNHFLRMSAEKFLKAAGPAAEDAVLTQIDTHDEWTRASVCHILRVIGTKKSIPALEKILAEAHGMVNHSAREALDAIKLRQ